MRRLTLPAIVLTVVASLCTGGLGTSTASADTGVPNGDVIANLWSWNWRSVGAECVNQLDPAGYGGVWVAPPEESLKHPSGYWWDIYQPYSYKLNSRFGTQSDFAAMINTCHGAGIKVYTDAVINHTAAQTGVGYDGTPLTDKYDPVMYDRGEYNVDVCDHDIANWSDLWEIQNCELVDLPDLKTSLESVRGKLAGFLNSQLALGVDGFRVDAAKHIPVADLSNIVGRLQNTKSGARPYVFLEIAAGEPPAPSSYFGAGDVLNFAYGDRLKSAFQGDITSLSSFSQGLLPAANAVSFVTNHDTERSGEHLSYKDGATSLLANVFQLAYPYTTPTVYSGFQFSNNDQGPPSSNGFVTDTNCASGWYCLDRDQAVKGMVAFHNAVGTASLTNWQSPASNVIGFGRGSAGFVAINNSGSAYTGSFAVGLANGTYCNVITACANGVTVSGGRTTVTVPAKSAVAFYSGGTQNPPASVTATYTVQAETVFGQNVYVVGNVPALGSWDPAAAVPLTTGTSTYPKWTGTGTLPPSTAIEYKFIIKQDGQPVIWETGANRTLSTPSTGAVTVDGGTFRR
ncbi:carbohydrate-binding module family 20 domain-containing protein [Actinophytocola sp.]|uniref:carbohydrate-binding module family 20 domain-containing protein n=1 Tax=Actinophytocola sp. TaxID=1872138 RepID=UPI00389AA8D1